MYSHPAWMRVSLDRPTIDVRTRALKWGRDRLALLLAHEACHNELYRELVVKHGVAAWRELQLNNPGLHELECIKFEMEICEELSISSEYANDLRTLHSLIPDPSLPKTNRLQFVAAVDKLRTI
jgi:hypothetical protein